MKKLLTTLLSLTLASSLTLGLVACGGGDKGGNDPKNMTSDKVTANQWAAALNESSFTSGQIKMVQSQSGKFTLPDSEEKANGTNTTTTTYTFSGDRQYGKSVISASGDKAYVDAWNAMAPQYGTTNEEYSYKVDDNVVLRYSHDSNKKWEFEVYRRGLIDSTLEMMYTIGTMYDSFEYNSAQKGYTVKEGDPMAGEFGPAVLKFKNEKLSAVYTEMTRESDGETITTVVTYSITYGKQTVNLPTTTSFYAGTWKTVSLSMGGNTLGIDDTIPEGVLGENSPETTVTADLVTITANNDGTASFSFMGETGSGAYEYYEDGDRVYFYSNDLPDGDSLSIDYDEDEELFSFYINGITVVLEKVA